MNKKLTTLLILNLLFSQEIGFVGDSTTESYYPGYTGGWFVNPKVIKYAVPGAGVIRAPYLYKDSQEFQDILIRRPEYTIMLLGSCDFWIYPGNENEWRTEYVYLLNSLKNNSKLILGTILYRIYEPASDIPIQTMNSVIKDLANNFNLVVADFNTTIGKNTDFYIGGGFSDGIHPNDLGQRKMGEIAARAIEQYNNQSNLGDTTSPDVPKNLATACGDKQVTLTWNPNTESDMFRYFLFRDITESGMGTGIKTLNSNFTSFTDTTVENEVTYYYRIAAGDSSDNRSKKSEAVCATPTLLKIKNNIVEKACCLSQNHPNPFNPTTIIDYSIPFGSNVNITIYDLSGNIIQNLVSGYKSMGNYSIIWNGTDRKGNYVCNGTYIYQINAGAFTQTKKMVLLK